MRAFILKEIREKRGIGQSAPVQLRATLIHHLFAESELSGKTR
jgi:hypothetical protein